MSTVYLMKMRSGRIIYVGCSDGPVKRFMDHRPKGWVGMVHNVQLKHYPSRSRAEIAERRFIKRFRPRFNKQHNPDWGGTRKKVAAPEIARNDPHTFGICKDIKSSHPGIPASRVFGRGPWLERLSKTVRKGDSVKVLDAYAVPDWFKDAMVERGVEYVPYAGTAHG